ncbi:UDP-glycosyltransferase UGT5 [Drosophila kikkawai]|uniref:UDP-glucuronosyltransferase n=1 Tax=Drosophila kikkawai TaxID=30033 RepID=A0A6P4J2I2_DROKI|nr:UDP-glycosyltransferase UGT5-like [Drosophila kikkawai]
MKFFLALFLLLTLLVVSSHSLNILGMFPHPAMSHFKFFQPIVRGLAEAGHHVDVISPFRDEEPPKGYKDYQLPPASLTDAIHLEDFEHPLSFLAHYVEFFILYKMGKEACNTTLNSQALEEILKHPPGYYDVILMEHFNTDCLMSVSHVLQTPVIAMASCALAPWHYERFGVPLIPSYISALFQGKSQEMSLPGRLANWFTVHSMNLLYKTLNVPAGNALIRQRFGSGLPSTEELVRNTSLMLINQHYSLSGPKPLPPNVIEVGGVHITPPKPLPKDLQQLLDNAPKGVILFSFGSQLRLSSLSESRRIGIIRALGRLEQQVILKWENDTMPNKPGNVHIRKWLPQRDILAHPNVRVFISHGGLMGTTEAVASGVPIVGVPVYGDQSLNIAALVQRGMAVQLGFKKLDEESLYEAVTKALDPTFKVRAKEVASTYNSRIQTPLETAIWWVEHVAETRGAPLIQPSAVHLSRFVYHSLDVYLVVALLLLLPVLAIMGLRRLCRSSHNGGATKIKHKRI